MLIPLAVRELSRPFYSPRQIEVAVAHVFGVDRQLIADGTYYVAEIDGRIVGAGGWSRRKTMFGGDQTDFKAADDALLDPRGSRADSGILCASGFRPARIGKKILTTCESAARAANLRGSN